MGLAVAATVSCAPTPVPTTPSMYSAPTSTDEAVITRVGPVDKTLVPRPAIDLSVYTPDFHDELRWPLTPMNHPSLEPRFAIAQALAQPGVGWIDLCGLGAQNRYGRDRDLLSYLRGWCSAIKGDVDAACTNLVPLVGTTTPGIDDAIKFDLANILADGGHAELAEHFINRHRIRDVEVLDLLAANYVEVGTREDAIAINRMAMDTDDHATLATRCTRLTRQIILVGDRENPALEIVKALATSSDPRNKITDPTCTAIHRKLQCWAKDDCDAFLADLGFSETQVKYLRRGLGRWQEARDVADWWSIADNGVLAVPLPGSGELTLTAFENAIRTARFCSDNTKRRIEEAQPILKTLLDSSPALRAHWNRLQELCK